MKRIIAAVFVSTLLFAISASALVGQGSSFVSNFIEQCKADRPDLKVNYLPTGSGAGRTAFINGTADFAASDIPFTDTEKPKKPYKYVPLVAGGIAIAYNVPGVTDLKLDQKLVQEIFAGKVKKWSDPRILKLNPKQPIPNKPIKVIVRSDSSGTSYVFGRYLGRATSVMPVPPNGLTAKGTDGVLNMLTGSTGTYGVTYAEAGFAKERNLFAASLGAAGGPTTASVTEALRNATVLPSGIIEINNLTPKAYPIVAVSYLIVPQPIPDDLKEFVRYSLNECQAKAPKLGYVSLPKP